MLRCQACQLLAAKREQVHLNLPAIDKAWLSFHKSRFLAPRDQGDYAMWLRLQTLSEFPDGGPLAMGESLRMQHQLVLKHRDALDARGIFAESQEAAQSEAEFRQRFKALFLYGALVGRHDISWKWLPNVSVIFVRVGLLLTK
ncbi:hypothetical protein D3C71_1637070 [compost metagenome]